MMILLLSSFYTVQAQAKDKSQMYDELDEFDKDISCLADAIYHEARGEPQEGQIAVGYTVINRMQSGDYPSTACGVVYQPRQYDGMRKQPFPKKDRMDYVKIRKLATLIYVGMLEDPTKGAIYFHEVSVKPRWSKKVRVACILGSHIFYKV